jgi:hypothetical protein
MSERLSNREVCFKKNMFMLGHLGIGSKMIYPWRKQIPRAALLVGTVLPDLIDKPLYYGWVFFVGRAAAQQSLISGSRTFGHTLLLLIIVVLFAVFRRSRVAAALAVGIATHDLIDLVGDQIQLSQGWTQPAPGAEGINAFLWPLLGWHFPVSMSSLGEHLGQIINPWILFGEVTGLCILIWDYRRRWLHKKA